jgi:hypothetical protein
LTYADFVDQIVTRITGSTGCASRIAIEAIGDGAAGIAMEVRCIKIVKTVTA